MAKQQPEGPYVQSQKRFWNGISNFLKEDFQNGAYLLQAIDYRTDPQSLTLLPAAVKESSSVVTDLLKWADTTPQALTVYAIGDTGNFYSRTTAGTWTNLFQAASSHGNGLCYFYGDDYVYYANDATLGRYGPISSSPQRSDNFLAAQGGVPTNTNSLSLVAASSQSADAADSASLSITGDLTLEAYFKATTLPTAGNSMTLIGKWDESGATRSYKLDLYGTSGYFGDGSNGSLTISVDTTDSPIDSACTGTSGAYSLSATNASFATGQLILIHQTQGTGAGTWMRNKISGYTAGTITLESPLNANYVSGAQVLVLKQYTNVTVNNGVTWTCKAWNGTTGGILAFIASGTITVNGTINVAGGDASGLTGGTGGGFRGGNGSNSGQAQCGEGTTGDRTAQLGNQGNGGGGGLSSGGGASGGNGTAGTIGFSTPLTSAVPGTTAGSADLTTMVFGGGGGGAFDGSGTTLGGGAGGGICFLTGVTLTMGGSGAITANGGIGLHYNDRFGCGGAGGSILLKVQTATLGTGLLTASGGVGASVAGGDGRIHIDYLTSYTGTTTPTINATQDSNLVTTTTIQARLGISNDGTAFEHLTMNLPTLTTATWNRLSVSWLAASSLATFYLNATSLGTYTGTKTSISDNASLLYVGANKGASVIQNYLNGLIDDVRIWNNVQSAGQISANNVAQLTGSEANLVAYWKLNSSAADSTANANNLTLRNAPSYSADVPFPAATTRLDIDQQQTTGTNTYTLPTSISEAASDMLSFTPTLDPQKSMDVKVDPATAPSGNWTLTIHDQQNNTIATATIANANIPTSGYVEFTFATPWRIVIGKQYHAHLTTSSGTSKVLVNTAANFSTALFHTYYGFLVNDALFHPIARMLNKIIIGNERYLATWDGANYNANLIAFPPNTHVRCYAYWRDYIAFGVWQEKTDGTGNIYDIPTGKIYFWDGISLTFNFWIEVAEGQVNAMYGIDNKLYIIAGWKGDLVVWDGGFTFSSGSSQTMKVKRYPYLGRNDYIEVYPQAMAMWRSMLHMGMAGASDSSSFYKGVYSWGTINREYPESLSYDYVISTGNQGSTVKIGMIYPSGRDLLVGWQDGAAYGCDKVNFSNAPASVGRIQMLLQDQEQIYHDQLFVKARVDHLPLTGNQTMTVKYKINRETSWESSTSVTDPVNKDVTSIQVLNGRFQEYQIGVDVTPGSTGLSPTILGVSALLDPLKTEQQF